MKRLVASYAAPLTRVQELIFLDDHPKASSKYQSTYQMISKEDLQDIFKMMQAVNHKLVRICAKRTHQENGILVSDNKYATGMLPQPHLS